MAPPIRIGNRIFDIMPAIREGLGYEAALSGVGFDYGSTPAPSVTPVTISVPPAQPRPDIPLGSGTIRVTQPAPTQTVPPIVTQTLQPTIPVPKREIAPLDLTGVPAYPTYPTAPQYGQQPTINQGQVAREQGRASLRAGLIGLLLGGGMGALSGAVGAAQGVQQGVETEYQRRQQEINAQNQLLAQDYQARMGRYGADVAQRQAALNEAIARQTQRQNELNALYEQSRDVYTRDVARSEAERARLENMPAARTSMAQLLSKVRPEDQPAMLDWLLGRKEFPPSGFEQSVKPMTVAEARKLITNTQASFAKGLSGTDWATQAQGLRSILLSGPEEVRGLAATISNVPPTDKYADTRMQLAEDKANARSDADRARIQLGYDRIASTEKLARERMSLQRELNDARMAARANPTDKTAIANWNRSAAKVAAYLNARMKERRQIFADSASQKISPVAANRLIPELDADIRQYYEDNKDFLANPPYDPANPDILTRSVSARPYPGAGRTAPATPATPTAGSVSSKWKAEKVDKK